MQDMGAVQKRKKSQAKSPGSEILAPSTIDILNKANGFTNVFSPTGPPGGSKENLILTSHSLSRKAHKTRVDERTHEHLY